ncbi:hypothetical protein [Embleya sp. NPDC059259]|uniref:hypothetical protein n=1 Tax=unclassified Embleya TaxID=2699296 RepID=UPI0036CEB0B9
MTNHAPSPGQAEATVAQLHRRIDDTIATIRATDQKAGLGLVLVGIAAAALAQLDPAGVYTAAFGFVLATTAMDLLAVLIPRHGSWLGGDVRLLDAELLVALVAVKDEPTELAHELLSLMSITARKTRLFRAAALQLLLLAVAVTVLVPLQHYV